MITGGEASITTSAVVALFSDLHVGSTVGLMHADGAYLDDGQHVTPSSAQLWLYGCWIAYWQRVYQIADGRPIIGILNGEGVDGIHHATTQLWSYRRDEHERHAVEVLREPREKMDELYVVRGTPAHVSQGAQSDERLARYLNATPEGEDRASHYNMWLEVSGVRFHVAHHRGGNHRPWTQGNAMRVAVLKMKDFCFEHQVDPPHLVVRSHQHKFDDTHHKYSRHMRGLATGAFQLATEYIYKIEQEDLLAEVGGYAVECNAGKYEVHKIYFEPAEDMRPRYHVWTESS